MDPGVVEYWSIAKGHQTVGHYSNTPVLQPIPAKSRPDVTNVDTPVPIQIEHACGRYQQCN
jgi:hypothetical protein